MLKSSVFVALLTSAAAFAPAAQQGAKSVLAANPFSNEVGAQAPLGYFDPMGLCKDGNQEYFDRLREVETRHGRCAMLAVTGWLTTAAGVRLPGMEDVGFGFKALNMEGLPMEVRGCIPLTLATAFFLSFVMRDATGESEFPGDYRNGFDFGWDKQSAEWKEKKRAIELNNGRAAQMGILGIMVHEQLGNLDQLGLPTP